MDLEKIKIYHTVEDTGNADFIEDNAPFKSTSKNCWAGQGYYFWERYIEHAHRWGVIRYKKGKYVICGSFLSYSSEDCFNLLDLDHLDYLSLLRNLLKGQKGVQECSLENIVKYSKKNKLFPFTVIRMAEANKDKLSSDDQNLIELKDGQRASFLSLKPRIVLFVENLQDATLEDFKVEFPDKYVSGYLG